MTDFTFIYDTSIPATFSHVNAVTNPFSNCSGGNEWNNCILKNTIEFNGSGATAITKEQILSFFSGSGTVTVGDASTVIRTHMLNKIAHTLNLDETKTALMTAYNTGKEFNQKIESVSYVIDSNWKTNLNDALSEYTDIVTIPSGITKFRLIFLFTASGFSKTVGIEWNVVAAA